MEPTLDEALSALFGSPGVQQPTTQAPMPTTDLEQARSQLAEVQKAIVALEAAAESSWKKRTDGCTSAQVIAESYREQNGWKAVYVDERDENAKRVRVDADGGSDAFRPERISAKDGFFPTTTN